MYLIIGGVFTHVLTRPSVVGCMWPAAVLARQLRGWEGILLPECLWLLCKGKNMSQRSYVYSYSSPTDVRGVPDWSKEFSGWSSASSGSQGRAGHRHAMN